SAPPAQGLLRFMPGVSLSRGADAPKRPATRSGGSQDAPFLVMRGGGEVRGPAGEVAAGRAAVRPVEFVLAITQARSRGHTPSRTRVGCFHQQRRSPTTSHLWAIRLSLSLFLSLALSGGPATDSLYRQGARQGKMLRARRCARKKDDNNSKKWEGGRGASAQPKGDFYCSVLNASLKLFGPRTTCVHRSACVFVCAGMRVARRQNRAARAAGQKKKKREG
ncbi:hypothetical protein MOQ_000084, partial [Trypanosoma cruzi marinkellei]